MKLLISLSSNDIDKQLVSEQDCGPYVLRNEIWTMKFAPDMPTPIKAAYTHDGSYIGDENTAKMLCDKFNIAPEVSKPGHTVCSIGKSADGKWYGWSHRAIYGFKIGDTIKEGDCGYNPAKGEWTISNELEAKLAAQDFAESVSSANAKVQVKAMPIKKIPTTLISVSKKPHKIKNPILLKIRALEKQIDKLRLQHAKEVKLKLQAKLKHNEQHLHP